MSDTNPLFLNSLKAVSKNLGKTKRLISYRRVSDSKKSDMQAMLAAKVGFIPSIFPLQFLKKQIRYLQIDT